MAVDLGTVAILAGLVLFEGARRVPAEAIVVRRIVGLPWSVLWRVEGGGPWRIVSWLPPLTQAVVIPGAPPETAPSTDTLTARVAVARRWTPGVLVLSGFSWSGLVLAVPVATGIAGAFGFVSALAVTLLLAIATGLTAGLAVRRLQLPDGRWWRKALGWCSPFAAPFAAEGVLETALRAATPLQVLQQLLAPERFESAIRPRVYDVVVNRQRDPELESLLTRPELEDVITRLPPHLDVDANAICPRCGTAWTRLDGRCPACDVALNPVRQR